MVTLMQDNPSKGTDTACSGALALPAAYGVAGLLYAQGSVLVGA